MSEVIKLGSKVINYDCLDHLEQANIVSYLSYSQMVVLLECFGFDELS